ncbi:MAG TPA: EAL domain-containing protein [Burkholderiales bacterium]|nr:EAL domain-containing protein [Burkholderiales bacterium]
MSALSIPQNKSFEPPASSDLHPISDFCSLNRIATAAETVNGFIVGYFKGLTLTSHFQPIFSLTHKRPVGYEALLRAMNAEGELIPPLLVFNMSLTEVETIFLDRLCRYLHVRNFLTLADDTSWLFLNFNPMVTIKGKGYGSFFAELLKRYEMPPHRIVVEILEDSIHDKTLLSGAVDYYRKLGCLIAIDDFGAGHSNFDRIWSLTPQIVKLDRSIIMQATTNFHVKRVLPNLINLIHESGSLSLMEGVETEKEALIAMDSGIDFIQGYYFCKPAPPQASFNQNLTLLPELYEKFKLFTESEACKHQKKLQTMISNFKISAKLIESGVSIEQACRNFIELQHSKRCYLLNESGIQIGVNIISNPGSHLTADPRLKPITDIRDANWSRRHYFRRAINNPGNLQISRPYLSITGANMCVTLSLQINTGTAIQVFCCDIDWNEGLCAEWDDQ